MNIKDSVVHELQLESQAIMIVANQLNETELQIAFNFLSNCKGKVVLTGMGKTGIIARKISATLASTGTTSIFLHAAEGIHGDLGMLQPEDVVIAISNSGNTQELLSIIPYIKFLRVPLISLTGNLQSQLALNSDAVLNCSVPKEFEPFGLVPTSSTTVALAVGDALAVSLLKHKSFAAEDFAKFHPGGTIGKKLLLRVSDLMHTGTDLPAVSEFDTMSEVVATISAHRLGCAVVIAEDGSLSGMITDGDLRRQLLEKKHQLLDFTAKDCMTSSPKRLEPEDLAINALNIMESYKITMLPVVDKELKPVGMLHLHDLIQAGII
ncbi:MAG: D-arabinose 5-phosphate isomerase [Candidatus Cloacimonetes bacterium HGW-Cloacimonetes-1]|jgi:arabinose-5-phosphate isomerase|nr:MAG: D-arabinose 5-phosphate isomerase [Candidatus Cloacimonetes bacterium HGW-Cloacimonetes-1]